MEFVGCRWWRLVGRPSDSDLWTLTRGRQAGGEGGKERTGEVGTVRQQGWGWRKVCVRERRGKERRRETETETERMGGEGGGKKKQRERI